MTYPAKYDPVENYRFVIDIDGFSANASFLRGTAPKRTTDQIEYRTGDDVPRMRKSAGLAKFDDVSLETGVTKNEDFKNFSKTIKRG